MARSFHVGPWTVEPDLNAIVRNGKTAHLEPKAMEVLLRLAACAGQTVSKNEIISSVWPDTFVGDDALSRAIYEIRKAFDDDPHEPKVIQTIPKRGYRLVAEVEGLGNRSLLPSNEASSAEQATANHESVRMLFPFALKTVVARRTLATAIVLAVVVATAAYLSRRTSDEDTRLPIKSVAVLPLQNLSGDAKQDYLADGIQAELTSTLARISSLTVKSRTSAQLYQNSQKDVRTIGRELDVDAVFEGTVRKSGNQLAITLDLIDARRDQHLWGSTFQRDTSNVLQMESEIALAVSRELNLALTEFEKTSFRSARPIDPKAYELFLEARHYMRQLTVGSVPKAISGFQQSIAKDPGFAPSYAGLAETYLSSSGRQLPGLNEREALEKAEDAASRAVELDPNSVEGHIVRGQISLATFGPRRAERELRRALQIAPSSAEAEMLYAFALVRIGREQEAVLHGERARELDPGSPLMSFRLSAVYYWAGHQERAIQQLKKVTELDPAFAMAYYSLTMQYLFLGRNKDVNCDDPRMQVAGRNPERLAFLTFCYGKTGRSRDAKAAFRQLKGHPDFLNTYPRMLAFAYLGVGEREQAIRVVQRAWRDRVPFFDEIIFEPSELDSDPRYMKVKKEIRARYDQDL